MYKKLIALLCVCSMSLSLTSFVASAQETKPTSSNEPVLNEPTAKETEPAVEQEPTQKDNETKQDTPNKQEETTQETSVPTSSPEQQETPVAENNTNEVKHVRKKRSLTDANEIVVTSKEELKELFSSSLEESLMDSSYTDSKLEGKTITLTNDISLNASELYDDQGQHLVINLLNAHFVGNNHKITILEDDSHVSAHALFGVIRATNDKKATVENLTIQFTGDVEGFGFAYQVQGDARRSNENGQAQVSNVQIIANEIHQAGMINDKNQTSSEPKFLVTGFAKVVKNAKINHAKINVVDLLLSGEVTEKSKDGYISGFAHTLEDTDLNNISLDIQNLKANYNDETYSSSCVSGFATEAKNVTLNNTPNDLICINSIYSSAQDRPKANGLFCKSEDVSIRDLNLQIESIFAGYKGLVYNQSAFAFGLTSQSVNLEHSNIQISSIKAHKNGQGTTHSSSAEGSIIAALATDGVFIHNNINVGEISCEGDTAFDDKKLKDPYIVINGNILCGLFMGDKYGYLSEITSGNSPDWRVRAKLALKDNNTIEVGKLNVNVGKYIGFLKVAPMINIMKYGGGIKSNGEKEVGFDLDGVNITVHEINVQGNCSTVARPIANYIGGFAATIQPNLFDSEESMDKLSNCTTNVGKISVDLKTSRSAFANIGGFAGYIEGMNLYNCKANIQEISIEHKDDNDNPVVMYAGGFVGNEVWSTLTNCSSLIEKDMKVEVNTNSTLHIGGMIGHASKRRSIEQVTIDWKSTKKTDINLREENVFNNSCTNCFTQIGGSLDLENSLSKEMFAGGFIGVGYGTTFDHCSSLVFKEMKVPMSKEDTSEDSINEFGGFASLLSTKAAIDSEALKDNDKAAYIKGSAVYVGDFKGDHISYFGSQVDRMKIHSYTSILTEKQIEQLKKTPTIFMNAFVPNEDESKNFYVNQINKGQRKIYATDLKQAPNHYEEGQSPSPQLIIKTDKILGQAKIAERPFQDQYWGPTADKDAFEEDPHKNQHGVSSANKTTLKKYPLKNPYWESDLTLKPFGPNVDVVKGKEIQLEDFYQRHAAIETEKDGVVYDILGLPGEPFPDKPNPETPKPEPTNPPVVIGDGNDCIIVHFETYGGTKIPDQVIQAGSLATRPQDPVKEGYEFIGWYYYASDEYKLGPRTADLLKPFSFSRRIYDSITLYAKWKKIAVEEKKPVPHTADGEI